MFTFSWSVIVRGFLVYVSVAVVAACIAYLANQLGRLIGKRKMSVLHLRPRHTSILITTFTGVTIALTTLTVFAALSEPVRVFIIGMDKLRTEESQLRQKVEVLRRTLAEGTFIWRIDEPIVHMTIPGGLGYERTRVAITSLLTEANARAILRTNKIASSKGDPLLSTDDIIIDYDAEQLEELINSINSSSNIMGLRVLASQNCLYREKAPVRFESWQVRKVFSAGEIVAQMEIKTKQSVMLELMKFIEETRKKAIDKGIRPIDGELGGELDSDDFGRLQEEIGRQKSKFKIVAIANRDLYETSSLDVRFEIRSSGEVKN